MGRRNYVHKYSVQRLRPVTHVDRKREAKRSGSMSDLNEMADELRQKCVLCGNALADMGANPWPLADSGECCDYCDANLVIPARITQYLNSKKETNDD